MACSPWRSQLTACRIRSCASICSSGRNLAEFLIPETGIQRISVHLAECHEGDNDESSSEPRASLSELPPHLTILCRRLWQRFQSGSAKATTSCVTSFAPAPANASIFPPPTDRIEPARSRLIERRHRLNNRLHLLARALTEPGEYARVAHRSRNRNAARLRRRGARPLRLRGIQRWLDSM